MIARASARGGGRAREGARRRRARGRARERAHWHAKNSLLRCQTQVLNMWLGACGLVVELPWPPGGIELLVPSVWARRRRRKLKLSAGSSTISEKLYLCFVFVLWFMLGEKVSRAWHKRIKKIAVSEDRTHDLRIMRPTRCQLRYHRFRCDYLSILLQSVHSWAAP